MTQRNTESYLENQLGERLQALLHNTRVEIVKAGFGIGTKFEVEIMDGSTKVAGFDAIAPAGDGGTWKWPGHVYADLAGSLRGRGNANLELKVLAPILRSEGVVIDFSAMSPREPERATAD
jgi:hypothetical protein